MLNDKQAANRTLSIDPDSYRENIEHLFKKLQAGKPDSAGNYHLISPFFSFSTA
jgi:hypothetical protein